MADGIIRRFVSVIFDRVSAKKVEGQFEESLANAGKAGAKGFLKEMRAAFDKRMADLKSKLAAGIIDPKEFSKRANEAGKAFNVALLKNIEAARKAGTLTEKEYVKLSRQFKRVGDDGASAWSRIKAGIASAGTALAAFFGARALIRFGMSAIREAAESEKVWRELAGTIAATGESFEKMEEQLVSSSKAFQKATVNTDEDYAKSLQRLIAITGNVSGSIRNMTLVADIAARFFGGDLAQATEAVAKGMNTGVVIINRMRFSLDELAKRSLGAAAEQTGTFSGKLKQLNNEWGEFKEQLGDVLVGSRDAVGAMDVLKGAVITLTTELNNNKEALRTWITNGVNKAIEAMRTFLQLRGLMSLTAGTQPVTLSDDAETLKRQAEGFAKQRKQLEAEVRKARAALDDIERLQKRSLLERATPGLDRKKLTLTLELTSANDQLKLVERNAEAARLKLIQLSKPLPKPDGGGPLGGDTPEVVKARAAALEKAETDLAVLRIQIEKGVTEEQAQEQLTRERLLSGHVARETATIAQLQKAWEDLDRARRISALELELIQGGTGLPGLTGRLGRGTETTKRQIPFVDRGLPVPDPQPQVDQAFDPWFEALHLLREEVEGAGTLFAELGQAWAEGGLAGFAKMAMHKVKENIARAIEEAAKAFGSFALGNPGAAAAHAKAAAGHTAAAAAWRVVGGAAGGGGGGGGGGGSASGGVNENRAPNFRGGNVEPVPPKVTVVLTGPGFNALNPEVQDVVYGAYVEARQRYGEQIVKPKGGRGN